MWISLSETDFLTFWEEFRLAQTWGEKSAQFTADKEKVDRRKKSREIP